ncbi:MAG: glutathione S-transferase [Rhizobiales bacterium]|nr:glutathione S-transferase [Hyphomicrobiales bacterium]
MILRSAAPSPFGRKVRIGADVLGLAADVEFEPADVVDPNDSVRRQNPLGKIPVLLIEDGTAIYDSRVVLEYLDHRAGGGRILPRDWDARLAALRLQALCDGILDASILLIYEGRWRAADKHEPKWVAHQTDKVARGMAMLEAAPPALDATPDVGQITLACALGYLDFRFARRWRSEHPRLVAWLDRFAAQVPAFAATTVHA